MTDAVLGNTYDLPASDFTKIRRDTTDRRLAARDGDPEIPSTAYFDDPHKFAVEAQSPPIGVAVGSARLARVQFWPALKDMSMYSLRVDAPEWHFAIFFDQPMPGDIGYRASASAYSREVLAAALNTHIDDLPNFPFTKVDPLIVTRNNPLDEHAMGER